MEPPPRQPSPPPRHKTPPPRPPPYKQAVLPCPAPVTLPRPRVQQRYSLPAKEKVHWTFHQGWGTRPLSRDHVAYATGDVADLAAIWAAQCAEARRRPVPHFEAAVTARTRQIVHAQQP